MTLDEQIKMLQDAIARFGSKAQLARMMQRPTSTVAEWCKTRRGYFIGLPEWARMWISQQVYGNPLPPATPSQPWLVPGWPRSRRLARAVRQLDKLAQEGDPKKIKLVEDLLDRLVEENEET